MSSNKKLTQQTIQDEINYLDSCKGETVSSLITLITPVNYSI
jgi:hypothetical protein